MCQRTSSLHSRQRTKLMDCHLNTVQCAHDCCWDDTEKWVFQALSIFIHEYSSTKGSRRVVPVPVHDGKVNVDYQSIQVLGESELRGSRVQVRHMHSLAQIYAQLHLVLPLQGSSSTYIIVFPLVLRVRSPYTYAHGLNAAFRLNSTFGSRSKSFPALSSHVILLWPQRIRSQQNEPSLSLLRNSSASH